MTTHMHSTDATQRDASNGGHNAPHDKKHWNAMHRDQDEGPQPEGAFDDEPVILDM